MWRWGRARGAGVCGIGAMEGAGPTLPPRRAVMWGMEQISADLALKNKNMLLEVERPAGRPYIFLCRGLLRFARNDNSLSCSSP